MNMAVVGAARVVFGADTSDFDAGARGVEGVLGRLVEKFQDVERRLKMLGTGITLGITVPFAAMVRSVDRGAGAFEGQMKRVEAALDNVTGEQLAALTAQARDLGPAVGKGATEAAEGIEELGLAGLSTSDILGGGLKATLDLAAAGMVKVAPAAGLVTDVMGQFKATAAELPDVVRRVVGAMDASKFGFEDFQLAVAQGGGIAAEAGVSFKDFATAIAATSTQFSSGSDAGTSFKTYIQSLRGNSDDAKYAIKMLGLEFYDAQGRMKPLGEQAAMLRKALSGLTDQTKNEALAKIFGADAARTAIGLMNQGVEGFQRLQDTVEKGDVGAKIAKRLEGSEAASKRVANAWESVKIAFGTDGGLLAPLTSIKNGFAVVLEAISKAPPVIIRIGAAFSAMSAMIGPVLVVLGHVGAVLLANFAASRFGLIGRAIGLVIAPISTLISILGEMGLSRALAFIGGRLAALLGPVGIAVAAFVLLRDSIVPVLTTIWNRIVETLGPRLEEIFAKVGAIFSTLSGGPVATAFSVIIGLLSGLRDVIGTVVAGVLTVFGELLVRTLSAATSLLSGFVDVVKDVVDAVTALLRGDFSGAWDAVLSIVTDACDAIVNALVAMVPDMELPLRTAYEAAKTWIGEGFASVGTWLGNVVKSMVDYVAGAFPSVVAAAKSVYEGVKTWLVDKFGAVMDWIGGAVKWITDRYSEIKKNLGLGETAAAPAPPKPAAPPAALAAPAGPKRTVDLDEPKKERKKKGRNTTYDAANREELKLQAELEAARLRGDRETEQRIQDRLDLEKQIEAYQRTGLTHDQAKIAGARDLALIQQARAQAVAKEIRDEQAATAIDVARITGNRAMEDSLERQEDLRKRIAFYYQQTHDLAQATLLAEADQAKVDAARLAVRQRWMDDDARDRAVRLAQLRGDTEQNIRQLQREIDVRRRARELEDQGVSPDAAMKRASLEWTEEDKARQTGVWRDTLRGGLRAAMDGNLGDWMKDWWKNRIAKGMEEALNSLTNLIAKLFSSLSAKSNGGGGLLGAIGKLLGSVGSVSRIAPVDMSGWGDAGTVALPDMGSLPGFATGGSFRVGGRGGIDQNLVAFRATRGEMVDIRKPGNDAGGRFIIEPSPWFDVRAASAAEPSVQAMGVRAAAGGSEMAARNAATAQRRRINR
ncbi:phage tail tape measure protein [Sphingomonas zeae]